MKILTVDDSKAVRLLVKKSLRDYDVELFEAGDGCDALECLRREAIDLLVTDISMPRMNGFELVENIRKDPKLERLPIVVLTSEGGKESILRLARLGVTDYVSKPFTEENVLDHVRNLVDIEAQKRA